MDRSTTMPSCSFMTRHRRDCLVTLRILARDPKPNSKTMRLRSLLLGRCASIKLCARVGLAVAVVDLMDRLGRFFRTSLNDGSDRILMRAGLKLRLCRISSYTLLLRLKTTVNQRFTALSFCQTASRAADWSTPFRQTFTTMLSCAWCHCILSSM